MTATRAVALIGLVVATPCMADGDTPSAFDPTAAVAHSQAAIGRTLGDHIFVDRRERPMALSDFRGKPLVINLVYTACADVCPTIVQTLYDAIDVAQGALGADRLGNL